MTQNHIASDIRSDELAGRQGNADEWAGRFREEVWGILFTEMEPYYPFGREELAEVVGGLTERIVILGRQTASRGQC